MNINDQQSSNKMRTWLITLAVFAVGIAVGAYFLGERQAFAGGGFLFLLLLACPVAMFFMMRGGNGSSEKDNEKK